MLLGHVESLCPIPAFFLRLHLYMKIKCPSCQTPYKRTPGSRTGVSKFGQFYRKSDRKTVQRYICRPCERHFSVATLSACYRQKKRHLNSKVVQLLVGGVSQREGAKILKVTRGTFVRKFLFTAKAAQTKLRHFHIPFPKSQIIEFDDMETFEHTKCKPIAISIAVEHRSRRILGYQVSKMRPKRNLSTSLQSKYGERQDQRRKARAKLFSELQSLVHPSCVIKSDQNPHYPPDVRKFFPQSKHKTYLSRRSCIVGQGELKSATFDPLFSLNHTCAVLRARTSRLIRKTWCTTKKMERLDLHLALVVLHHNSNLKLPKHIQHSKEPVDKIPRGNSPPGWA